MTLADAGKLALRIAWDGRAIRRVDILSTRPQAARLLRGGTPEQAAALVPLLFSLCGKAQAAAAQAAVAAAQGREVPQRAQLQRQLACEAMQEHLWRLLLDWPVMLGIPAAQAEFVRWHGRLRDIAAGRSGMPELAAEIGKNWLGVPLDEWLALRQYEELQSWWQCNGSPAAEMLAALDAGDMPMTAGVPLLPELTAAQVVAATGGWLGEAYAAKPSWAGCPAETGALARHASVPLLQDVLRQRPSGLLARVLAKAYDMLLLAGSCEPEDIGSSGSAEGVGLAVVHTARGLLMHQVRLGAGRVEDYCIVAPTEWNFHPLGALAAALTGFAVEDASALARHVRLWVLALDPCVEYEMEIIRGVP